MLTGKSIVLGVSGGIAAYKAAELVSRLKKLGAQIDVVMTKNATEFVNPLTFETLSSRPVIVDTFARPERWEVEHVALAQKADLMIVAPATANVMAKLSHGIADDMLTTTLLATKSPVLLAPAMNTGMWEAAATRENVQTLLHRGVYFIGPESGLLACGDRGTGRMSEPEEIVKKAVDLLCPQGDMAGLSVLVTAGPTVERLDPVRYLSNDSSGKMGYALAEAARDRGAKVTLVSGPVHLAPLPNVEMIFVTSTRDLYEVMTARCSEQNLVAQAAAPADYYFVSPGQQKIKKQQGKPLILEMAENPDVAKAVGEQKKQGQILIGFAAETCDALEHARKKLEEKHLDLIVANDVTQKGAGFGVDTNIAALISKHGEQCLPLMSKRALADKIWDEGLKLRAVIGEK